MTPLRLLGLALTVARHPAARAALRAAPRLVTPEVRAAAREKTLDTAYRAGVVARKILKRD
jgi:hypothetical protein